MVKIVKCTDFEELLMVKMKAMCQGALGIIFISNDIVCPSSCKGGQHT